MSGSCRDKSGSVQDGRENLFKQFGERPAIENPIEGQGGGGPVHSVRTIRCDHRENYLNDLYVMPPRQLSVKCVLFTQLTVNRDRKPWRNSTPSWWLQPSKNEQLAARPCRHGVPNAELRTREYLTEAEVEKLIKAAGKNRWGHRDATMILVAYRHGLRVSELVDLRWDQIDFDHAPLHVRRVKQGTPATHPILGDEMRALRRLQREQDPKSPFVFTSERGSPFTTAGFARLVERAGEAARLGFKAHPHMLRHACGFALANKGHDTRALQAYLGHRNIQHTVRYTELSPDRFKDFWR